MRMVLIPLARRFASGLLTAALTPIPVEVSSTDVRVYVPPPPMLVPDTSIVVLEGAGNLGTLLWAFILYQGIFTIAGRPADWILPIIVKAFPGTEKEQWFLDFSDGFAFNVPPQIEGARVAFFLLLGYYTAMATVAAFDGDNYWAWAIPGAASIPVGLFALARGTEPAITRESAELELRIAQDFDNFASARLSFEPERITTAGQRIVSKTPESAIISQFRRAYGPYRDESVVPDKVIKRVIRAKMGGRKPDKEGDYLYLSMSNLSRESRQQLQDNLKRAELARQEAAAAAAVVEDPEGEGGEGGEGDGSGTSFSDFVRR